VAALAGIGSATIVWIGPGVTLGIAAWLARREVTLCASALDATPVAGSRSPENLG
jgi:hypothetical protein